VNILTSGCWYIPPLYLRSSSIWGHFYLKHFIVWFGYLNLSFKFGESFFIESFLIDWFVQISLSLQFGEDPTSSFWDISFLIFEVIFHCRSSSFLLISKFENILTSGCWDIPLLYLRSSWIGGHFQLKFFYSLVWLFELKFQIWGRSNQWLLRYICLIFEVIFKVGGCLHWIIFIDLFGNIRLSLKFGEDPASGCWDR
jgi:hypothetical protein